MHKAGNSFGEPFLKFSLVGRFVVFFNKRFNFVARYQCKYFDVFFGIGIRSIEPELVKSVWACTFGIELDVARFGFSEFSAVGFGNKRTGQCKSFTACFSANEFCSGGDISPLVGAAHLQFTTMRLIQMEEIVALHQLIGKFSK
jgi:hypothetical protein